MMKNLQNLFGRWGIKLFLVTVALAWLVLVAMTWAEAAENRAPAAENAASSERDEEYSFDWLDPEKKIYVLQNRRYLKANRLLLSAMVGPGFSNPYRNSYNIDPRLSYYFTESWGFEAFYTVTMNSENGTYTSLKKTGVPVLPVIREIKSQVGAMVHWVPWYAKINVFNQILHFDWYFGVGGGSISADREPNTTGSARYVREEYFAAFLSTGHQYYVSNHFIVRLDFTGAFYHAPVSTSGDEKAWFSNYNFGLGIGYRF